MGTSLKGKELGAGLSQRKDGLYRARIQLNKEKTVEKSFRTLTEAREWLANQRFNKEHGSIYSESMTVEAWYDYWYHELKEPTIRDGSLKSFRNRYEINMRPVIGSMLIKDVKPLHCQKVLNDMKGEYSWGTIQQTRTIMSNLFRTAMDNDLIKKNPVNKSVKNPAEKKKTFRVLTVEEQNLVANVETYIHDEIIFILNTGVRTGELIGLQWGDIDFENRMIHIERSGRKISKEVQLGETKTESSRRTIPMTTTVYNLLKNRKKTTKSLFVFAHRSGLPISNEQYNIALKTVAAKLGILSFSMHTLRHTFATRCIEAGMKPKTLQKILGHASITITMDLYVHVTDESKKEEMALFERYYA